MQCQVWNWESWALKSCALPAELLCLVSGKIFQRREPGLGKTAGFKFFFFYTGKDFLSWIRKGSVIPLNCQSPYSDQISIILGLPGWQTDKKKTGMCSILLILKKKKEILSYLGQEKFSLI